MVFFNHYELKKFFFEIFSGYSGLIKKKKGVLFISGEFLTKF